MPTPEVPTDVNEPGRPEGADSPAGATPVSEAPTASNGMPPAEQAPHTPSTSRWVDYDTHELLEMISELEDERRWARLREGALWAVLIHALLILLIALLPRYIFQPRLIETSPSIKEDRVFTYLDTPKLQPKLEVKPPPAHPQIDRKTLDEMTRPAPPVSQPAPQLAAPPAPQTVQPPPLPPSPQSQSQAEAPRPAAVPARPNFAMNPLNPADQLRDAMKGAARNPGMGTGSTASGGLPMHPGAAGGLEVLSDTQGVDFSSWLHRWHYETQRTWDPLIPDEVNPPIQKSGMVAIRFKVLPNGRVTDMQLEGRSGDTALDRAAWGALTGSNYPPLPKEFHGPYLELRAYFFYNMEPPR